MTHAHFEFAHRLLTGDRRDPLSGNYDRYARRRNPHPARVQLCAIAGALDTLLAELREVRDEPTLVLSNATVKDLLKRCDILGGATD